MSYYQRNEKKTVESLPHETRTKSLVSFNEDWENVTLTREEIKHLADLIWQIQIYPASPLISLSASDREQIESSSFPL